MANAYNDLKCDKDKKLDSEGTILTRYEFARELEKRTRKFAVRIIRLSTSLPKSPEAMIIRTQITKSGTSVGANYRDANKARSKADFRDKIKICESKASETQFWLEVITALECLAWEKIRPNDEECSEKLAIFTKIGSN